MTERREAQLDVEATKLCELLDSLVDDVIVKNELKIKVLQFCSHAVGYLKEDFVVSMPKKEPTEAAETPSPSLEELARDFRGTVNMEDLE